MLQLLIPGKMKLAMYLGVALIVTAAIGYHFFKVNSLNVELSGTKADLVQALANQVTLEDAIDQLKKSQALVEQQRKIDQEKLNKLAKQYTASRKKVGDLRKLLSEHDLGYLMLEKPGLLEIRMNRATTILGKEFETLTGGDDD